MVNSTEPESLGEVEEGCTLGVQGLWVVGKAVVVVGLVATVTTRGVARVAVVGGAGGRVVALGVGGGGGGAIVVVAGFLITFTRVSLVGGTCTLLESSLFFSVPRFGLPAPPPPLFPSSTTWPSIPEALHFWTKPFCLIFSIFLMGPWSMTSYMASSLTG